MNFKRKLVAVAAVLICILSLGFSANAQKRKTTAKKTKTAPAAETTNKNLELKAGAEKVSTQIKNLSRFIYNLGGVARVIEDLDRDIADGKASRSAPQLNEKNKQAVVGTIRNLRDGLAALEIEFRTKPALKNYLAQIQGITEISGRAEDQAAAGQMVESGKTLLIIIEKLTDALASLP